MKPIRFKCPYGNHDAYYYGGNFAGCVIHGQLLYTDIPREIIIRKRRGWKTVRDVVKENDLAERVKEFLARFLILLIVGGITLLCLWLLDVHGVIEWLLVRP